MTETILLIPSAASVALWLIVLLLPWRPWSRQPYLDADAPPEQPSLEGVTALIPARNEAAVIGHTLQALNAQGHGLRIIVIDDQSMDETAERARRCVSDGLEVIAGQPLPSGWSGKLWALEQGFRRVTTPYTLLLDADIRLQPGIVWTALDEMKGGELSFLSLMAVPHMGNFWSKLLMPAFVYFFKLLYPFHLSNSRFRAVGAAAGGFILLETQRLERMGGFAAIKGALIDDCALAKKLKSIGTRTWIGLTHSARSQRPYESLAELWDMVVRTAFTQLRYSLGWLLVCSALMLAAFVAPLIGALHMGSQEVQILGVVALVLMAVSYVPTLMFYGISPAWALLLPLTGALFLAMTWSSAIRYWRGQRTSWRGRAYTRGTS